MLAIVDRIGRGERCWTAEVALRGLGVSFLGLCTTAFGWLHRALTQPHVHGVTTLELAAATLVAASLQLGLALAFEGPGLFRLIPAASRHAHFTF
ncbi:hypothetical protein ACMGDH_16955 [Sphingomonas sp. DT-207]|uniref:hypothetical protein n=1 Tax=Sphingomonas sp. DT-207 TaxID=3396167 RepID=UPI003F19DD80